LGENINLTNSFYLLFFPEKKRLCNCHNCGPIAKEIRNRLQAYGIGGEGGSLIQKTIRYRVAYVLLIQPMAVSVFGITIAYFLMQ